MSADVLEKSQTEDGEMVLPTPPDNTAAEEIGARADSVWTRGPGSAPNIAKVASRKLAGVGGRVAIVDGCRTPFCKAGTDLRDMDVIDMAGVATAELLARNGLPPDEVDASIFVDDAGRAGTDQGPGTR